MNPKKKKKKKNSHFVFTMNLLDRIIASQPSRIVILSSIGHEHTPKHGIDFQTLNDRSASNPASRYGRSKLANILFGKALARRLANEKVWVNMGHPGFVYTELARNNKDSMGAVAAGVYDLAGRMCASKPEVGCLNQLYLATSPEVEKGDLRGLYFVPVGNELRPSKFFSFFFFPCLFLLGLGFVGGSCLCMCVCVRVCVCVFEAHSLSFFVFLFV
jgi:retinol dehydrogenase-14